MPFSSLGLSMPLLKAVGRQSYETPTEIQLKAIPAILIGVDVLALAQTGSGKTAAYALPILEKLMADGSELKNRCPKVLVLVPTRELAVQVEDLFLALGLNLPKRIKTMAVYGGVSINPQMIKLQGVEVLVATPGRLLDLVASKALQLSEARILVLDEADKMLNMGFSEEVQKILALLPAMRQNILLSATLDSEIDGFVKTLLRQPLKIEVDEEGKTPDQIDQIAYLVSEGRKGPFLRHLIKNSQWEQVLVFAAAGVSADKIAGKLQKNGITAASLHGQKSQGARTEALSLFKSKKLRVLVATDLASRGIDIEALPCVINYELPRSPKDYVHRIGRTGRAGMIGHAASLICPEDMHHFEVIQKKMGKKVSVVETDEVDLHGF